MQEPWLAGVESLGEPGEGALGGLPGLDVFDRQAYRLTLIAQAGGVRKHARQRLVAEQIGENVRVAFQCVGERAARIRVIALGAEGEQSSGPYHVGAPVVLMLLEQGSELAIAAQFEQASGEDIANALVVVRIESQQVAPVIQRLIVCCAIPQALGEGGASAHVGAGFEDSPEMTDPLFEGLFAQDTLASFDTLAI